MTIVPLPADHYRRRRYLPARYLFLLTSASFNANAALASAALQETVQADRCSVAIHGNVSNANVSACPPSATVDIAGFNQLRELLSQHEFDPELLRLLNRRSYDAALRRVEAIAASSPSQASHYYSLASAVQLLRWNQLEAADYARRAYEEAPNDIVFLIRYASSLSILGRRDEARQLQGSAYRRRAQFSEWGRLALELFAAVQSFSDNWERSSRFCPTNSSHDVTRPEPDQTSSQQTDRALDNPIGTCPLNQESSRAVEVFRNRVAEAGRALQQFPSQNVLVLNLRHVAAQYVLIADVLLRDSAAANATIAELELVDEELVQKGGPWAILSAVGALYSIDLAIPPEFSRLKYERYDQALRDATMVPAFSYDPSDLSYRGMSAFNSMTLAVYQSFRAIVLARFRDYVRAWTHAESVARTLRAENDSTLTIIVRLMNFDVLVQAGNALPNDPARSRVIDTEFNSLVDRLRQNSSYAEYGRLLVFIAAPACQTERLTRTSCQRPIPYRGQQSSTQR